MSSSNSEKREKFQTLVHFPLLATMIGAQKEKEKRRLSSAFSSIACLTFHPEFGLSEGVRIGWWVIFY
jgi:hypothetical protein